MLFAPAILLAAYVEPFAKLELFVADFNFEVEFINDGKVFFDGVKFFV